MSSSLRVSVTIVPLLSLLHVFVSSFPQPLPLLASHGQSLIILPTHCPFSRYSTPLSLQDEVIFFGLLADLFPAVNPPRKQDLSLEEAVTEACIARGLQPDEAFRLKVVQLEEVLAIRHCVFVMGPPGSGKSSAWSILTAARALRKQKTKVRIQEHRLPLVHARLYTYIHR